MPKIILDLCGGTGSWSKPYRDAGVMVALLFTPLMIACGAVAVVLRAWWVAAGVALVLLIGRRLVGSLGH